MSNLIKISNLNKSFENLKKINVLKKVSYKFRKGKIFNKLLELGPLFLLYISVLNEFDFNYLQLTYFSFNFPFILIFYWSLKKPENLGY